MKTVKELETALSEYKSLSECLMAENKDIHNIEFKDIKDIPLKVMLKFAEKHALKPEFETWSKTIRLNFYGFNNKFGKFQIILKTGEVERTIPPAPPVSLEMYREVKKK